MYVYTCNFYFLLAESLVIVCMQVFGGSWGSTLALTYSETYPERVCYPPFISSVPSFCNAYSDCLLAYK